MHCNRPEGSTATTPVVAPPSGNSGPVTDENKDGKCIYKCRNDGGCEVKWYNYRNSWHGTFYCWPKSHGNGTCNPTQEAPTFCNDCHATRASKNAAPCKEPEPVVTCDYFCQNSVCYVRYEKKKGWYSSWGTYPHWNKNVPAECKNKCTKQVTGCEA